ncbi:MAG: SDR family oxidoreductase [Holosporales bacterium]|nr:SDR family oxidoreductase [Holosporales bacterium]
MSNASLIGRTAIVTGANQGLGLAIAKEFSKAGADLAVCARDGEKLSEAYKEIEKAKISPGQRLIAISADVSRQEDVRMIIDQALHEFSAVHILVNNAGIYGPMGSIETVDWDEWKTAIEINLFGSVLMCRAMLPHFRQNKYGKIIQVSGGGATNPMPRLESYATSKCAIVRFIESLALDCIDDHIDVNAISPGLLDTRLLDSVLDAGPNAVGQSFYRRMLDSKEKGKCTPLETGAKLCLFLASSSSDGITGKLISALWDDYEDWPNHIDELQNSDLYTLRRITGRDRGKTWGDK